MPRRPLFNYDKALLSLSFVPLQCSRNGVEPVSALFVCANSWEREFGRRYFNVVALYMQLDQHMNLISEMNMNRTDV